MHLIAFIKYINRYIYKLIWNLTLVKNVYFESKVVFLIEFMLMVKRINCNLQPNATNSDTDSKRKSHKVVGIQQQLCERYKVLHTDVPFSYLDPSHSELSQGAAHLRGSRVQVLSAGDDFHQQRVIVGWNNGTLEGWGAVQADAHTLTTPEDLEDKRFAFRQKYLPLKSETFDFK